MSILDELFTIIEERDPQADVRTRPNPVFDSKDPKVKDHKDHFPLGDVDQARNALARANQYKSSPSWYDGSVKELRKKVADAVKKEFPSIDVTKQAYKGKE